MKSMRFVFKILFFSILLGACQQVEETYPPDPPSGVQAIAGNGQVRLFWAASDEVSTDPDVAKVTRYKAWAVTDTTDIYQDDSKFCTADRPDTTCKIAGLTNGVKYYFVVSAFNQAKDSRLCENHAGPSNFITLPQGQSCASAIVSATPESPGTLPGEPTALTAVAGNARVTLSWTAPASNGGLPITGYKAYPVEAYAVSDTTISCITTGALTCAITDLVNGTAYTFAVVAMNSAGPGPASTTSSAVTPATLPGPPTAVRADAGQAEVTVRWNPPTVTGGAMISGYKAYAIGDSAKFCITTGALSCMIYLVNNGTAYTFAVKAINALGTGLASEASAPVTPTAPANWTGRTSGTSNTLNAVATAAGNFVAVGQSGTVLSSSTGMNWTVRNSGTINPLKAVAGSASLWVAVGTSGTILTSPNGTTWSTRNAGTTDDLNGVVYTGSQWVIVGLSGSILTSPDGTTWTSRASGTKNTLKAVTWSGSLTGSGAGQLVAVGEVGTVLTSPDGATWTPRNSGATIVFNSVIWIAPATITEGGHFVAVGGSSAPTAYSSLDGITWTPRVTRASASTALYSLAWTGNKLLIVGSAGAVLGASSAAGAIDYLTVLTGDQNGVTGTSTMWVIVGAGGTIFTSP